MNEFDGEHHNHRAFKDIDPKRGEWCICTQSYQAVSRPLTVLIWGVDDLAGDLYIRGVLRLIQRTVTGLTKQVVHDSAINQPRIGYAHVQSSHLADGSWGCSRSTYASEEGFWKVSQRFNSIRNTKWKKREIFITMDIAV